MQPNILGQNIKRFRLNEQLTQSDLAKEAGISYSTLVKIEQGETKNPAPILLDKIAEALNIEIYKLFESPTRIFNKPNTEGEKYLPFDKLNPDELEQLTLRLVIENSKKEDLSPAELFAGPGDGGRDIRRVDSKNRLYFYQCKRYKKFSTKTFIEEIDKIKKYLKETNETLYFLCFVLSKNVGPRIRDAVEAYALKELGLKRVNFWTPKELDALVRSKPIILEDYFDKPLTKINSELKSINESVQDIQISTNKIETFIELNVEGEFKEKILESSILINQNKLEEAKIILNQLIEKPGVKSNVQYFSKILNNLGNCYSSSFETDDLERALGYFEKAIKVDPNLIKSKANMAITLARLGGEKNIKRAFEIAKLAWDNSTEDREIVLTSYLLASNLYKSPRETIDFIESEIEVKRLAKGSLSILEMLCRIYLQIHDYEKALEYANQMLSLDKTAEGLILKGQALLIKSQSKAVFDENKIWPHITDYTDINHALDILKDGLQYAIESKNPYLIEQTKLDIAIACAWKNETEELSEVLRKGINVDFITEESKPVHRLVELQDKLNQKKYREALENIQTNWEVWINTDIRNKYDVINEFVKFGSINEAKFLLDRIIEIHKNEENNPEYWNFQSVVSVLLEDKVSSISYGKRSLETAKKNGKSEQIKKIWNYYIALMHRYADDNEVDRLMETSFEYQNEFPEDVIIRPFRAFDETNKKLTKEFQEQIDARSKWYNNLKNIYLTNPAPTYLLEKSFNRLYPDIITRPSDIEFTIEYAQPGIEFQKQNRVNFEKAEVIVLDYITLLDLSKSGIFNHLRRFNKKFIVPRSLFNKIQSDLLQFESKELRNIWNFLRTDIQTDIVECKHQNIKLKSKKIDDIFPEWVVDVVLLSKARNGSIATSDLRFKHFLNSEEIPSFNISAIAYFLVEMGVLDSKMYSSFIGNLAERLYVFLSYNADDLFNIVLDDNSNVTLRSIHLINQMNLPGSDVNSFLIVFNGFLSKYWKTGSVSEDKVKWFKIINDKCASWFETQGGDISSLESESFTKSMLVYSNLVKNIIKIASLEEIRMIQNYLESSSSIFLKNIFPIINEFIEKRMLELNK